MIIWMCLWVRIILYNNFQRPTLDDICLVMELFSEAGQLGIRMSKLKNNFLRPNLDNICLVVELFSEAGQLGIRMSKLKNNFQRQIITY